MNTNKRYSFRRIFWVMAVIYLFIILFGIIILTILTIENKELSLNNFLSWNDLRNRGISLLFNSVFFYFALNAFYGRLANRERISKFIKPVVIGVMVQATYHCLMFFLLKRDNLLLSINDVKARDQLPIGLMSLSYLMTASFFIIISLLVAYLTYLRDERKQNKILEEQKMQLEIEMTQANYNFLKAQINPHFLHNTLNFLYSRSLPLSPEVSEGILTLSHIMRYALREGNAKDGKAPLKDEIEHLRNVIKINQLRFSNKLNVHLQVEGDINGGKIIPFVLITLVENALKHGDVKSAECPIVFSIHVEGKKFYFYSHNKKKTGAKELSTGIGLGNIKKRLNLMYGNKCHFLIKDEAEFYTTELTIDPL